VIYVNSQGAEHVINWELASTPEGRQLISKFKHIAEYLQPPFIVESIPKPGKGSGKAAAGEEVETKPGRWSSRR